jgi:mono/diheme cytochrome c family protein
VLAIAGVGGTLLLRRLARPGVDVAAGGKDFAQYCAACHSGDGRGGGPAAASLGLRVPDVTTLAARSGGSFDAQALRELVDGRHLDAAGQRRDMPVWGRVFERRASPDDEAERTARIDRIVLYLWSLQR